MTFAKSQVAVIVDSDLLLMMNLKLESYRTMDIHTYQNSFLSWDEAVAYIDLKIGEYAKTDYQIRECKIVYLVGRWLAAISYEKKQMELNIE